jgi:hypothetical protein
MRHLSNPNLEYLKYDEVVSMAIALGIPIKHVYNYLATLGVQGERARIIKPDLLSYAPAIKVAYKKGEPVTGVRRCDCCGAIEIITIKVLTL